MKILRLVAFAIAFYLVTLAAAFAQTVITTGPITINDNVAWEVPTVDATTAAQAQALQLRIRDNTQTGSTFATIIPNACATSTNPASPGWTCTNKVTTQLAAMVNVRGTHNLFGSLFDTVNNIESPVGVPFVLTTPLGAPTGLRITR
jgi:hypothetical protein